jgi:formate--tetrahydrofolate ligase
MAFKSDLEIAQAAKLQPIQEIATKLRIPIDELELYGKYKAKLPLKLIDDQKLKKSKLILVTAMTPTPAGEGKTTTSIGLCEGLNKIGKKTTVVLREPSLGPVFERWRCRWRILTGCSNGRHQPTFYRRFFCRGESQ